MATSRQVLAAREVIEVVERGPSGVPGAANVSSDPDNRARLGSDNGVFVPDGVADFEAYYILAKN